MCTLTHQSSPLQHQQFNISAATTPSASCQARNVCTGQEQGCFCYEGQSPDHTVIIIIIISSSINQFS
jgi:hypothetical protein